MKQAFLVAVLALGLGVGCGETLDTDGGTDAGPPVTTTWTISSTAAVSDACDIHDPEDPLTGMFEITVQGSMVTMDHATLAGLETTGNTYDEGDEVVIVDGVTENEEAFPPCRVEFVEGFTLTLADPAGGFEGSGTIQVTWEHIESDISDVVDGCDGEWFVDLPCTSELTFTLTQVTQ